MNMHYWIVRLTGWIAGGQKFSLIQDVQDHDTAVALFLGLKNRYDSRYQFAIWIADNEGNIYE